MYAYIYIYTSTCFYEFFMLLNISICQMLYTKRLDYRKENSITSRVNHLPCVSSHGSGNLRNTFERALSCCRGCPSERWRNVEP